MAAHTRWMLAIALVVVGCAPPDGGSDPTPVGADSGSLQVLELTGRLRLGDLEDRFASLGDERREAVHLLPPEVRSLTVDLPPRRPVLRFALGRADVAEGVCLSPTTFRVLVGSGADAPHLAHEVTVADRGGRWVDDEVPLASWAGQTVSLHFEAWPEAGDDPTCTAPVAVVGDVRVVAGETDPRPDLWVIVIDAWRADHAGYLTDSAPPTPRIDELAAGAHRFTDAAAPTPWTRESVFALLTGGYATAWVPGTRDSAQFALDDQVTTIPEVLGSRGYRTLAVYANAVLAPDNGIERGFDAYAYARGDGDLPELVDTLRQATDPRRPRLVYVHLISPHVPYCEHEEITERHLRAAGFEPPWPACAAELADLREREVPEPERELVRAFYRGEVEFADWVTGRVLDQVDEGDRSAWVVVTADHGEELWDHGGFEHGHTLYPELLHIPLLIRGPAGHASRDGGATHDHPVNLVDVGDTLLELAGEPPIDTTAGFSLAPLLDGRPLELPEPRTRLVYGPIYGHPRVGLLRGGEHRLLALAGPAVLETIPAGLGGFTAVPTSTTEPSEVARFAAEWGTYQRLATTGAAVLRVGPGDPSAPDIDFDPPAATLTSVPDADDARYQFTGLTEAGPAPRVRVLPDGAWTPLPHPWSPAATPTAPGKLEFLWESPATLTPSATPDDTVQDRLRTLGYVE